MRIALLSTSLLLSSALISQTLQVGLVPWASGLTAPVDVANAGDDRLFVVQQNGLISIITDSMTVLPTPFLDLTSVVTFEGEQGLLGMAFDPDYSTNGFFYVNYVSSDGGMHTRVSRFSVSGDPDVADAGSEEIIYMVDQPFGNHNGGDLEFGPDGYLYIALGDGGDAGDPLGNAQDLSDPLGDLLRIDVSDGVSYTVPSDNPYIGDPNVLPEIWASGLRNPYRFGFDRANGDLWIGDVGQGQWEEIDHVAAGSAGGQNFGWRCYEGFAEYNTEGCGDSTEYDFPVAVQFNGGEGWCAIIGGRVYRGAQWPQMQGHYIYTDFCVGEFWSIRQPNPGEYLSEPVLTVNTISGWSGIGEDASGELYATNVTDGDVYKIFDACPNSQPMITFDGTELTSTTGMAYQWYLNDLPIADATGQTYAPTESGNYFVQVDFVGGCSLKSEILAVITTGIGTFQSNVPTMTPNPANTQVVITLPQHSALRTIRLLDVQGREVRPNAILAGDRTTIETTDLPAGSYLVQFSDVQGNALHMQRFVVAH